jgi:WD40 repeat protein
MLRKSVSVTGLIFFVLYVLSALRAGADVVSDATRQFGLGEVRAISVSPDRRFMASAGLGGLFLWDFQSGALIERLEVDWSVSAVAFSPDSKVLLAACKTMILSWNAETGAHIRNYVGHTGEINRIQFSADGETFVSASSDNTARVWSVATGTEIHSVKTPRAPIVDVAISPDGKRLVTIDTFLTNCVKLWDVATETQIGFVPKTNWTAQRVVFTAAGEVITAGSDLSVTMRDLISGQKVRSYSGINGAAAINDLWFPNGSTLAAACSDGKVYLWNLETSESESITQGDPVLTVTGVPGAFLTVVGHSDYGLRLRDLPSGETLRTFFGHTTSTHSAVAFSPDGKYVLSGGTEGATRLWDRKTGAAVRNFIGQQAGTVAAAFTPDGSKVLTTIGLPNPAARLWDVESGELVKEFKWPGSWPMSAVLSPDGSKLAAGAQDGRVRIFNVATGTPTRTLTLETAAWIRAIAMAPNAPLLACSGLDFGAELYNYETGELLQSFYANAGWVTSVAFSPDGKTLLIGWQDGLIRLFDVATRQMRKEFFASGGFLNAAVYSPDGQFILTGEGWPFFVATIYDAQTGQELRRLAGQKWEVGAVAFSADGRGVLTGAEIVREWDLTDLAARLRVDLVDGRVNVSWSLGQLQQAANLAGPWEIVAGTTGQLSVDVGEPLRFYRVIVPELMD